MSKNNTTAGPDHWSATKRESEIAQLPLAEQRRILTEIAQVSMVDLGRQL